MSSWHLYPRYFVIPDRSWRGVAFIDDPLNTDGLYVGPKDDRWDAPDWRDADEIESDLCDPYSDGVHRDGCVNDDPDIEDEFFMVSGEEWTPLSVKKAARLLYPDDFDAQWAYCDRHADRYQLTEDERQGLKAFVTGVIYA